MNKLHVHILLISIIVASTATFNRNKVWQNEVALWTDVVNKSPQKIKSYNNLANALQGKNIDDAINIYYAALKLFPTDPDIHYNLGSAYLKKGLLDEAIRQFEVSIKNYNDSKDTNTVAHRVKINTNLERALNNLGSAYYLTGNINKSVDNYLRTLQLNPNNALAHYNLAVIYHNSGVQNLARYHLKKSYEIDPVNFRDDFSSQM